MRGKLNFAQERLRGRKIERPDQGDEDDSGSHHEQVERHADANEVGETITAGAEDHHVGLVTDGRCESIGGGQGHGHDEGALLTPSRRADSRQNGKARTAAALLLISSLSTMVPK